MFSFSTKQLKLTSSKSNSCHVLTEKNQQLPHDISDIIFAFHVTFRMFCFVCFAFRCGFCVDFALHDNELSEIIGNV